MKIGILTFHCAHNYGAVLQCYALQETLKNMGHKVEIIDYRPSYLITPYKIWNIQRFLSPTPQEFIKKIIKESLTLRHRPSRYKKFQEFIYNRLNLSQTKSVTENYDAYIIGSDQIWNPQITKGFDPNYFGYFNFPKKNKKYISYAASMEKIQLTNYEKEYFSKALKNFDSISVRENNLSNLLQPLTDKPIKIVLDPTLLANPIVWNDLAKVPQYKKQYVIVYQIRESEHTQLIAQKIAKDLNLDVVNLKASPRWYSKKTLIQNASPEDFLGWIKHASCIITTSFHGTAFSIIFNRPFYYIKLNDGNDSRSSSLLENIGLSNRIITPDYNSGFKNIDYTEPNKKLLKLREQSAFFLNQSLIQK